MIFFDVNMDRISANISQVLPGKENLSEKENGQRNQELDSTDHTEKANVETLLELLKALKKIAESEDETVHKRMADDCKSIGQTLVYPKYIMHDHCSWLCIHNTLHILKVKHLLEH